MGSCERCKIVEFNRKLSAALRSFNYKYVCSETKRELEKQWLELDTPDRPQEVSEIATWAKTVLDKLKILKGDQSKRADKYFRIQLKHIESNDKDKQRVS